MTYLHAHLYLTAALAGVLVAGAVVWAFDRYVLMIGDWPLVGRAWRQRRIAARLSGVFELERRRQAAGPWCGDPDCDSPQCWEAGAGPPYELDDDEPPYELDDDEAWSRELADMNRARRADELDERLYVDLTDDPDLIAWDAKQHAARVWEIVNVQFPTLRADIAAEYAHAAAAAAAYWKAAA